MSSKDQSQPPKESRSGIRKVTSLSAEQLERKRANDRLAQRSIRQRTKEHIESLESQVSILQAQVAEMRPRSEGYVELLQRNAALQEEVSRLRHKLASLTGSSSFPGRGEQDEPFRSGWHSSERPDNTTSSISTTNTMVSPFPSSFQSSSNLSRAPSAVSTSSRSSHPHDRQQHFNTQPPPLGETPASELLARTEPYATDEQLQHDTRLVSSRYPLTTPHYSFGSAVSSAQQPSESSFSPSYHVSTGLYQNPSVQPSQRAPSYPYTWVPQSEHDAAGP